MFEVINIENMMNNVHKFQQIKDVIEVAKVETIHSNFQVAIQEVKRKVKRFLEPSHENQALFLFYSSCVSDNMNVNILPK